MKINLVTFADGRYSHRADGFIRSAISSELFDSVRVYSLKDLSDQFKVKHGEFCQKTRRGFGYWVWKPEVILESILDAQRGDVIVYADAGFEFNRNAHGRFLEYIELLKSHDNRCLCFSSPYVEAHWTKGDLLRHLEVEMTSQAALGNQIISGLFLMENASENIDLLHKWKNLAIVENYHFSDDSKSRTKNHTEFVEHRHDQSIASLLLKEREALRIFFEMEDYFGWAARARKYSPLWASRLRTSRVPSKLIGMRRSISRWTSRQN